jgi:hypothetical protein
MTDEVVTRLYRALVDELRRRGHPEGRPVKVSELYQDLVPYRAVRSSLGVELNADYEHALLRLLAGERGLLRLEPEQAREELRREVDAPYPFVGLFRKFSASNVWVEMPARKPAAPEPPAANVANEPAEPARAPARADAAEAARVPAAARPRAQEAVPPSTPQTATPLGEPPRIAAEAPEPGARPSRRSGSLAPVRAPVQLHADAAPRVDPSERLTHAGTDCAFCAESLPVGRRVRFCPHCGGDQRLMPCPRCDAVLERDWRYCISCGHEVGGG